MNKKSIILVHDLSFKFLSLIFSHVLYLLSLLVSKNSFNTSSKTFISIDMCVYIYIYKFINSFGFLKN